MDKRTQRDIDTAVEQTLEDAGICEPPVRIEDVLEHLALFRDYYDLKHAPELYISSANSTGCPIGECCSLPVPCARSRGTFAITPLDSQPNPSRSQSSLPKNERSWMNS